MTHLLPFPSEVAVGVAEDNLPAAASELLGRTNAVQDLRGLLSAYRVVTLTGPGGIGKTRLALEVARGLFHSFPGGHSVRRAGVAVRSGSGADRRGGSPRLEV